MTTTSSTPAAADPQAHPGTSSFADGPAQPATAAARPRSRLPLWLALAGVGRPAASGVPARAASARQGGPGR